MARDRYDRRILVANPERRIAKHGCRPDQAAEPGISLSISSRLSAISPACALTKIAARHGREARMAIDGWSASAC